MASRLATTAVVAYGAYRLGSWAWNAYFGEEDGGGHVHNRGDFENEAASDAGVDTGDLLYEWCKDYQNNVNCKVSHGEQEGNETDSSDGVREEDPNCHSQLLMKRSRRSRLDWSKVKRSHRPSPSLDHHHHSQHHHLEHLSKEKYGIVRGGGNGDSDGKRIINNGVQKAASLASSDMAATMNATINASISHNNSNYNNNKNNINHGSTHQNQMARSPFLRKARMERCRLEASRAMMDFLPTLKKAVLKETNVLKETEELKRWRGRRKEIWEGKRMDEGEGGQDEEKFIRERERYLW